MTPVIPSLRWDKKNWRMHASSVIFRFKMRCKFADAPPNREVAGLGKFAPVHKARTALETREEAVRLNAHDGIRE